MKLRPKKGSQQEVCILLRQRDNIPVRKSQVKEKRNLKRLN